MKWDNMIKSICGAVGLVWGVIQGAVTGIWTPALSCLLTLNVIDYLTGFVCAAVGRSNKTEGGRLSSSVGLIGIARKVLIWVIVIVGTAVDRYVIGAGSSCQTAVALFYAANEALSVLENVALIGVPIPAFLMRLLEVLRDKSDQGQSATGPVMQDGQTVELPGHGVPPEDGLVDDRDL